MTSFVKTKNKGPTPATSRVSADMSSEATDFSPFAQVAGFVVSLPALVHKAHLALIRGFD